MKTGRKSTAELQVVTSISGKRIEPPDHLNESQADEWHQIVSSLPADYFRPGDVPLLAAFCTASAFYKEAQRLMQEQGLVLIDDRGISRAHPASQILTAQASSMAQMAVKLRLCPSSRYDKNKAAKDQRGAGLSARPWEAQG